MNMLFQLKCNSTVCIILLLLLIGAEQSAAQSQIVRWMRIGSLHNWYSSYGSEMEIGRTGDANDQNDGLRWPAEFQNMNNIAGKSMWIGTTNYYDRVLKTTLAQKVVAVGTRSTDPVTEVMPVSMKMIGKFRSSNVIVDGETASDNKLNDKVDEVDPNLIADRLIINELHTALGISITRKVYAFSQQYNDNYFIYDYVFKNTGIRDLHGTMDGDTLTGVYFFFQYRYAHGNEMFKVGPWLLNSIDWGRNSVNQVIGTDPSVPGYDSLRAQYSWYGRVSSYPFDDFGAPFYTTDGHLGAVQYVGTTTLHADKSATEKTDDLTQPRTTKYVGSDSGPQTNDQYNPLQMTRKYETMSAGHAVPTHADAVGDGFANQWGSDAGGFAQGQGFGPYTLNPGDSIHIVFAEAVDGISRQKSYEVGANWLKWYANNDQGPFTLPNGTTTTDGKAYKNAWVKSGEDSLKRTFRRVRQTYKNNLIVPAPPPPPNLFEVNSGGNRIQLKWGSNAASSPNFDGYEVYRAIGKPDTFYTKVFECNASNAVHAWDDTSALRSQSYYYYIVSKDNGSTNTIQPGNPLRSSKFFTMTNKPAYLQRPPKPDLENIRIVPNPFNIRLRSFGRLYPDRLAFYGLPAVCTIKIFTERGDLIKTIHHTNTTADETWDSVTDSRQIVTSGVYIAVFESPDGKRAIQKFVVIR